MKKLILTLLGSCLAVSLPAQGPDDNLPATKRTASELGELLAPVALYPDALLALILPASTAPADIVLGARFVNSGGDPARVQDKSWDSSVKALVRYPDTLKWLDENLEWTTQVGDAFIEQPVEVMESIQELRAKARALGNLIDTPQQRIVMDDTAIRIIPAQPDYIFEPRYDYETIYYERPLAGPVLFFSAAYLVGSWLDYDCDWHHHRLYRGEWHQGWDYNRDRNRRGQEGDYYINNNLTNSREWRPDPARHRSQLRAGTSNTSSDRNSPGRAQTVSPGGNETRGHHSGIARPKPIVGAPHRGETLKRAEPGQREGKGNDPTGRASHSDKGDSPKNHVITPKSVAPGTAIEGKHGNDTREHKRVDPEPGSPARHEDSPPKHGAEGKTHIDQPKHEPAKTDEPKHKDAPKHEEAPKHKDAPKHEEAPKHQDAPKHEEAPKHKDAPKREEAPKHQDSPKHPDAAKNSDEKPRSETAKDKNKHGDKKTDHEPQ